MIYLDNAATTKQDERVIAAMLPFLTDSYANPSADYSAASEVRARIARARKSLASLIGALPEEIIFTSGGTEADNMLLRTFKGKHIISSTIEHHAVLNTLKELEACGSRVSYVKADSMGRISPEQIEREICEDTALVSVMFANNEIGTIEPVKEIGETAHRHGLLFHTDAVQALGHIPIDVASMNIDYLSASAHKMHGPKGTGMLFAASGRPVRELLRGGDQEKGRRAGTENVPGIIGFGTAAELAAKEAGDDGERIVRLRDAFIGAVLENIPCAELTGDREKRLPGSASFIFRGVSASDAVIRLDMKGICCSAGAACDFSDRQPSHVLRACGYSEEEARSALRFTLSKYTTGEETDRTVRILKELFG